MTKSQRPKKIRLDIAVVERGLFQSRQEAQTAIMDGAVLVNNEKLTKPGTNVSESDSIELRSGFAKQKYVSRGGLKLEKAIEHFKIDVKGRICLDVGASTGGFTDCLLQYGAAKVFAVDVGYGQIDWKLRTDKRVVVKERLNARYLTASMLYEENAPRANLATMDCSFISLTKILPAVIDSIDESFSETICLIKPQFEAGRESVNKGVIKDRKVHVEVLKTTLEFVAGRNLSIGGLTHSPLKGPKGNIEFLLLVRKDRNSDNPRSEFDLPSLVDLAFEELHSREEETDSD